MIFLEIIILFGCIIYAAKLGGIGVGMAGGLGMAIAVFGLGLKPGAIPIDVILIILSVIFAISCMQLAGGMDYMVKLASKLLRSHPKYINILAPSVTFVLTVLGGTGYTAMSVLNVIQEVAKENHVRPSQPLTSAVIASQIAITASPISAATAAMYVVVEKMGVSFGQALAVIVPSAVFGAIVTAIISSMQGVDLDKDPIFQKRLKEGLVSMKTKKEAEKPTTRKAKISVVIFLLAVVFIVALLLFKPYIGHTLGSRDIIIISMLMAGLVMYWFCDISLDKIKNTPIFGGGMESLVVVLGIVWMSCTHSRNQDTGHSITRTISGSSGCRILLRVRTSLQPGRYGSFAGSGCCQLRCRCQHDSCQLRRLLRSLYHQHLSDNSFCNCLRRHRFVHGQKVEWLLGYQPPVLPPRHHRPCCSSTCWFPVR